MMPETTTATDWVRAQAHRRAQQSLLPVSLKAIVRSLRDPSLALSVLGDIRGRVREVATKRGWVRGEETPMGKQSYLLRSREQAILDELNRNQTYLWQLRSKVASMLQSRHAECVDPGQPRKSRAFHGAGYAVEGTRLTVDSEAGLGTASMLEGEPEGWDRWLLDDYLRRCGLSSMDAEVISMSESTLVRALVLGAGAGGVATAVASKVYPGVSFSLVEQDWVLSEKTWPDEVESRNAPLDETTKPFDLVSLVLPAPGTPSALHHRDRYEPDGLTVDPASVGPRQWLRSMIEQVQIVRQHLTRDGLGYLLIPLGTRTATGYEDDARRLGHVLFVLERLGLRVLVQHQVLERQPVRRPHVSKLRPQRVSLVVQRGDV